MPVIARTRIGRYYRTTIPREVRKLPELRENDEVEWVFENGMVYVKKAQGVNSVVRCPSCGFESSLEDFKKLREPWRFRFYEVKMLECPRCKIVFNYYEGFSPRDKRYSFTIKMRPWARA
ncbi:MAG: AbrB/MazE/SpoVT family DNA-binding domain-containing protein [Desulfurococcaceae archaeon]